MRIFIVALLILTLIQSSNAQKEGKGYVDSLYAELPKMKDDTNKVRVLATICFELRNVNASNGLKPGLVALHLAEKLNYSYGQGLSHISLASCYGCLSNYPEQMDHYLKACSIFETLRDNNLLCYTYLSLADCYDGLDSTVAQKYLAKTYILLPQITTVLWKVRIFSSLGNLYRSMGEVDSAMKYLSISLKMSEKNNLTYQVMLVKTRIGLFYYNDQWSNQRDSQFVLTKTALDYFRVIGATRLIAENCRTLAEIRSIQATEKGPFRKQYLREAMSYAQEALNTSKGIKYMANIYAINFLLSRIYSIEGRHDKALEHLYTAFYYNDSLFGMESINKASKLSWQYEQELKQQQMDLLKLQNRQQLLLIIAITAGVVILIIVVIIIISNRKRLKKAYLLVTRQKEEIECQKEEVETQNEALENTLDKLKQTQSQLIQSEKMASLGMLTAGIAHEINNPVNFINSGAISLQKDYEDLEKIINAIEQLPPEAQKLADELGMHELMKVIPQTVEDIKTGVQRTSEIINGLRNFTRMDASELKEADIHEGLESTLLLLNSKIKDRITVVKEFDERIGFIKCYPGPLNQVFMNLLNNAIDAIDQKIKEHTVTDGQYQIGITTKLMDTGLHKQVTILITDNGTGIPDEIKDKLFDPFFTTKEVGKGTGLGLSICHGIIEKHGGSITFESKVNEGSIFTIIIPVA